MKYIGTLIIAAALLVGCGGPSEADIQATVAAAVSGTTQAQVIASSVAATQEAEQACADAALKIYADAVDTEIAAFQQQAQLVSTTPRVSLGVPLQKLLDIQSETRKIKAPQCLTKFHER